MAERRHSGNDEAGAAIPPRDEDGFFHSIVRKGHANEVAEPQIERLPSGSVFCEANLAHGHCFHSDPAERSTEPRAHEAICCHCGGHATFITEGPPRTHGKFLPK